LFRFNGRFIFLGGTGKLYDQVKGELLFTKMPAQKLSIPYHTRYGGTTCTTTVYTRTTRSLSLALHRQFNVRKPEIFGLCEHLYAQQVAVLPSLQHHFAKYSAALARHTFDYRGALWEELEHYADKHPKRALRVRNHIAALVDGSLADRTRLLRDRHGRRFVVAALKIELAKIGKVPRITVNLEVGASLVGAWLAKCLKTAMAAEPLHHAGLYAWFCPAANYKNLKRAFDLLITPPERITIILFSDDAAIAVAGPHGTCWIDMDISSCDKSHTRALFDTVRAMTPQHMKADMETLMQQLKAPLVIRAPNRSNREKVVVLPVEETLYSGSVLTTLVNNVAVMSIALRAHERMAATPEDFVAAAQDIGYIVECKGHQRLEKMQFLKHSPCQDVDGVWQPVLNLGVYTRSCGHVYGELPGSKETSPAVRAHQQHAALLRCMWPNTHFPMLDHARSVYTCDDQAVAALGAKLLTANPHREIDGWPHLHFTDEAVLKRYDLVPGEATTFDQLLSGALFHVYTGPDIDKILTVDYGLTTNHQVDSYRQAEWLPNIL